MNNERGYIIDAMERIVAVGERCRCDRWHPGSCGCGAVAKEIAEVTLCEIGVHRKQPGSTKCKWCWAELEAREKEEGK